MMAETLRETLREMLLATLDTMDELLATAISKRIRPTSAARMRTNGA